MQDKKKREKIKPVTQFLPIIQREWVPLGTIYLANLKTGKIYHELFNIGLPTDKRPKDS